VIYEKGLGVPVDPLRAATYYEKALALGDDEAALPLAELLVSGAAGMRDYERAVELLKRAIENAHDSERACLELARLYDQGLGVVQNDQVAFHWYEEAAKQVLEWAEYPDGTASAALLKLGEFSEKGRGAPYDLVQAADYYVRSHTMRGMARAAWLYERKIVPRDNAKATFLLEETLQSGAVDFWLRLEEVYPERGGEPKAFRNAARLLEKAIATGSVAAKFHLGLLIGRGLGPTPDEQTASTLLSEAASAGYVPAMLAVLEGQGGRRSGDGWDDRTSHFVEALSEVSGELPRLSLTSILQPQPGDSPELIAGLRELFRLAAKRQAQRGHGAYFFMIQPGVDLEQALSRSFQEGDVASQWLLVDHWEETGRLERAVKWYQGAANAGYASVQYYLGVCYALGYGVPADRIMAYKWLSLGLAQDFQPSGHRGNHAQVLDDLESTMTPADVVAAQREALDWWRKHRPFKLEPLPKLP
jgi:TPR repeat protein